VITREERDTRQRYETRYGEARTEVVQRIERAVIGADWGANGYTTVAQADRLGELLHLAPGKRLLDLGAGRGWPGLYLAVRSGCRVVLSDVPLEGLRGAIARAEHEGIADRVTAVASSARAMPFVPGSFDAVVHTDVLC
jgi:2-polyprenyl-3-methyl-5-hydroxy-6-metoxy-1,4-benzoquinol methylase